MAPRPKPRTSHSKTGCLTCKSRKVKCSEERPYCGRCTQAGFVCKGYASPPKAWVFYSREEAQGQIKQTIMSPSALKVQTKRATSELPPIGVQTPLKRGNSDPFDALAVPIGPREHDLIQIFEVTLAPSLYRTRPAKIADVLVGMERQTYRGCLRDEAAAYALLSREAGLREVLLLREGYTEPSILSLHYMVKSQEILSKRLSRMTGSEGPDTVFNLICIISYLAATEVTATSPTAGVHIRALHQLIARYDELVGPELFQKVFICIMPVIFSDVLKTLLGSTHPRINLDDWLPFLDRHETEESHHSLSRRTTGESVANAVHQAVGDETIKAIIVRQRERVSSLQAYFDASLSLPDMILLSIDLHNEILELNRLLRIIVDAEEYLLASEQNSEQVQHQCARAYLSLSVLLWSRLILPTSINMDLVCNVTPRTLQRLQRIIMRRRQGGGELPRLETDDEEARLWALYVGAQVELHRKETTGSYTVCGPWFLENFRNEANSMHFHSWQQAVRVFEQFLYNKEVNPHISQWWEQVVGRQAPTSMAVPHEP